MIKMENIQVEIDKDSEEKFWTWKAYIHIQVDHREEITPLFSDPEFIRQVEHNMKSSILRFIFEDVVDKVQRLRNIAMPQLLAHQAEHFDGTMNELMDIFLGNERQGRDH